MSVPKGKRSTSTMEFLMNARNLEIFTLRKTKGFPTRWRADISTPLVLETRFVYERLKMANNLWPTNAHEAQLRRDYLMQARGKLDSFIAQLEIACEVCEVNDKVLQQWSMMAADEIRLISGVIDSDRRRFKF